MNESPAAGLSTCRRFPPPGSRVTDRGSGTVLGLALIAVLLVMALVLASVAHVVHARGTAQSAADLAALASAPVLHDARDLDPCAVAVQVAGANDAGLLGCDIHAGTVHVATVVTVLAAPWPLEGRELRAVARARAGPVYEVGSGSQQE